MSLLDDPIGQFCLAKFDEMVAIVADMDDAAANTVPPSAGGNSAYQLLTHVIGMAGQWTHFNILGKRFDRDRDAEFVAAGSVAALLDRAVAARAQLVSDLAQMTSGMSVADNRNRPDIFWINTADGVLLHVFEETTQHLGHLEIVRDLLTGR